MLKGSRGQENGTEVGNWMSAVEGKAMAVPVEAATVVILRDGSFGLEACLLHRQREMAFASQAWVFPGGKVDRADRQFAEGLRTYPYVIDLARRLGEDTT